MTKAKTAVIKFDKAAHGGAVRGAVNGQPFEFAVDSDVTVTEAQLAALQDSGATFSIVTPLAGEGADEGSSAPSTTVEHTAIRAEVPPAPPTDAKGDPLPTPELSQRTDDELGDAQKASQDQAETGMGTGTGNDSGAASGSTAPTAATAAATTPKPRGRAKAKH